MTDIKFLDKFKLDEAIQFANYMNNACCMYAARWILGKVVFEELPPQTKKLVPFNIEALIFELKPLFEGLKYAFLRPKKNFLVVISAHL